MKCKVIIILLGFVMLSCTSDEYPNKPENVYAEYHKAVAAGNIEKALNYISAKDQSFKKELYEQNSYLVEFDSTYYSLTKWELKEVQIYEDEAVADLAVEGPDIGTLFGKAIAGELINQWEGDKLPDDEDEIDMGKIVYRQVISALNEGEFDLITSHREINFLLEDGEWRISFDLEKKQKVRELVSEASRLSVEGKFKEAKEILEQVSNMDPDDAWYKSLKKRIEEYEAELVTSTRAINRDTSHFNNMKPTEAKEK